MGGEGGSRLFHARMPGDSAQYGAGLDIEMGLARQILHLNDALLPVIHQTARSNASCGALAGSTLRFCSTNSLLSDSSVGTTFPPNTRLTS